MKNQLFLIIPLLLLFAGCAEDEGKIGRRIYDPTIEGEVDEVFIYPSDFDSPAATYYATQVNAGQSLHLYIGEFNGVKAKFLLKFTGFLALPDSFSIQRAEITVTSGDVFADTSNLPSTALEISVHRIDDISPSGEWHESSVTWDSLHHWMEDDTIAQFNLPADFDTHSFNFEIDPSIVSEWFYADSLNPNQGLVFNYSGEPGFIRQFYSSENMPEDSLMKPRLQMVITPFEQDEVDTTIWIPGEDDTVVVYATNDVFIARDDADLDEAYLYIGRTITYRSLFRYDLTELVTDSGQVFPPFGVYVNRAEFILFVDSDHPQYLGEYISAAATARLEDTTWVSDPVSASFDPAYYGAISSVIEDSLTLNITALFNQWVTHPELNTGFAVRFTNEGNEIARIPIWNPSPDDTLSAKRPYLRVIYTRMRDENP